MRSAILLIAVLGSIIVAALVVGDYLTSVYEDNAKERVRYELLPPPIPGGAGADAAPGDGGQGQGVTPPRDLRKDHELCRVTARFVDKLGDPIPGTRVVLAHDPEAYTVSNEYGRVQWRIPDERSLAAKTRPMRLRAFCNGFASREFTLRFVPGADVQLGDLELKPGGAVGGVVVDAEGNPVEGARVLCSRPALPHDSAAKNHLWGPSEVLLETRTGGDGEFYVEGAPTGLCRIWAKTLGSSYHYTNAVDVEQNHAAVGIKIALKDGRLP